MAQHRTLRMRALFTGTLAAMLASAVLAGFAPARAATPVQSRARVRHHVAAVKSPAPAVRPAAAAAGGMGMVVAVDPETGLLGLPSQDDMLQLSVAEKTGLSRSAAGLAAVRMPGGAVMVNLQGRFMDYSVVRLDAGGRPRLGCLDDASALSRWLGECESAPRTAPALEVK